MLYRIAIALAALALLLAAAVGAEAATKRSGKVRMDFVRAHACPATGLNKLPCKGWIIDHIIPLCAGGPDAVRNLQWQTVPDARAKDRIEKRQCAVLRRQWRPAVD